MPSEYRYDNKLPVTIAQTPTITAGAYSAGDAVGGLLTFANAGTEGWGSGVIKAMVIIDDAKQSVELELHLFDRTFTPTADNAAFAKTDAVLETYVGFIQVETGDYSAFNDNSVATATTDLPFNLVSGGSSLFGQLVTRGTPTYAAITDLTVKLMIIRD